MNKPQLSAEMKRIKDSCQCKHCIDGVIHSSDCAVHNEPADKNGECDCEAVYISVFSEELSYYWNWWFGDGWTNDKDKYHLFLLVKKELATALEEQRATFVDEVKNRKATIKWLWGKQKTDDECFLMVMEQVQRIAEFSKLNQLKGSDE